MKGVLGLWSILANLIKPHSYSLTKIRLLGKKVIKNLTDSQLEFVFLFLQNLYILNRISGKKQNYF